MDEREPSFKWIPISHDNQIAYRIPDVYRIQLITKNFELLQQNIDFITVELPQLCDLLKEYGVVMTALEDPKFLLTITLEEIHTGIELLKGEIEVIKELHQSERREPPKEMTEEIKNGLREKKKELPSLREDVKLLRAYLVRVFSKTLNHFLTPESLKDFLEQYIPETPEGILPAAQFCDNSENILYIAQERILPFVKNDQEKAQALEGILFCFLILFRQVVLVKKLAILIPHLWSGEMIRSEKHNSDGSISVVYTDGTE
jgi:hypothetical protein